MRPTTRPLGPLDRSRAPFSAFAAVAAVLLAALLAGCHHSGTAQDPHSPAASPGAAITRGAAMVEIPAGTFDMGCDPDHDPLCEDDEKPKHEVTLGTFRIDRTEVTESAFAACVAAGACTPPYHGTTPWEGTSCVARYKPNDHGNDPVACVTWAQADAFCHWAEKRLPTEAEWEKAARGADDRLYPWGNEAPDCTRAALDGCPGSAVGAHPAGKSPYGVLDLAGGVWEWTGSWYSATAYSDATLPTSGPATGEFRVVRGTDINGTHAHVRDVRAANRFALSPEHVSAHLGFRCAR